MVRASEHVMSTEDDMKNWDGKFGLDINLVSNREGKKAFRVDTKGVVELLDLGLKVKLVDYR